MKKLVFICISCALALLLVGGCVAKDKAEEVFLEADYEVQASALVIKGKTNLIDGVVGIAEISSSNALLPHQPPSLTKKEFIVDQGRFQITNEIKGELIGREFKINLQIFSITDKGDPTLVMQPAHVLERYGKNLVLIEGPQVVKVKTSEYGRQNYKMLELKETFIWDGQVINHVN